MSDYLFPWHNRYHNRSKNASKNDFVYCGACGTTGRRYSCACNSLEKVNLSAKNEVDAVRESKNKGHLHVR